MRKILPRLKTFFFPSSDRPIFLRALPYLILGVISIAVITGIGYGWTYTDSPGFCGTTCHTMPPQNVTYLNSPHANVYCTECHIGRSGFGTQLSRKFEDLYEVYSMVFHRYSFPIQASRSRPASVTCEKCHQPEAFSNDSLVVIDHFQDDISNSLQNIYLVLKTGGGAKQQGLGRGIHWHIVNKVEYFSTDQQNQNIPYIRVHNDDGTTSEYLDVTAGIEINDIPASELKIMDCITCHNRVTHDFPNPSTSMDTALARGLISKEIPEIKKKGVEVLSFPYTDNAEAMTGIADLDSFYREAYPEFYSASPDLVVSAVSTLQAIYNDSVFHDQKVDWSTHPDNIGHQESPGCFRCHDGKHLDARQHAVRLECNLCHSIPVAADAQDLVSRIEISRGPEPNSHQDSNWIKLHHSQYNATCANCHTTANPGGTSDNSFCSNSVCHGTVLPYAGFDAVTLRQDIVQDIPGSFPTELPLTANESPTSICLFGSDQREFQRDCSTTRRSNIQSTRSSSEQPAQGEPYW
jgi:hypothetical protein